MKKFISLCLCFIFLSTSILCTEFNNVAHADALTTSMVGATAAALMSDWGFTFTSINADASNMQTVFDSRVEEYVNTHGGSLQGLFGYEVAKSVAGKLVVGYQLYNGIIDFVDYVQETYNDVLSYGKYGNSAIPSYNPVASVDIDTSGCSVLCTDYFEDSVISGFKKIKVYNKGSSVYEHTADGYYYVYTGAWELIPENGYIYCRWTLLRRNGDIDYGQVSVGSYQSLNNKLNFNDSSYVKPTVLNPDKEWSGTIGGQAIPDTNLDQLIGEIYDQIADNNIDIDGEIIDIPVPPSPIDPDTPLSDVPWGGLDDTLTGIDTNIADIYESLNDGVGHDVIGELTGINSAVNELADAVGHDVIDAINEQTGVIEQSSAVTAEAVGDIADALEDEAIDWQKFDLRGLFPFCIPFDIYNMLEALDASPTAPHVQIPFVIESMNFSYTIDLDFSEFDQVAAVMRTMELIVYGIALAWATSKVIKW